MQYYGLLDKTVERRHTKKGSPGKTFNRLQLERGLFWYGHHPKMQEMASDRSSRAENWTDLCKIAMRVFFNLKKCGKMIMWSKTTQHVVFRETNL